LEPSRSLAALSEMDRGWVYVMGLQGGLGWRLRDSKACIPAGRSLASDRFVVIAIDALADALMKELSQLLESARAGNFGLMPSAVLRGFGQCERWLVIACARGVAYPVDPLEVS
jgi:hypothetical protein